MRKIHLTDVVALKVAWFKKRKERERERVRERASEIGYSAGRKEGENSVGTGAL